MYGFQEDEVKASSGLVFGLNTGKMVKFEWINNAGKDGGEGEALDIQFLINDADRPVNMRMFPVTKAFKDGNTITDQNSPEFKKAVSDFNAVVTHILGTFTDKENIKAAFSKPIANFKEFCKIAMALMPKDYEKIPLDIFAQYQWDIRPNATKTYLELPRKMSYGKWLHKSVQPVGNWKEVRHPDPSEQTPIALKYVDETGNIHPFIKNGWFMMSKFANQQVNSESQPNVLNSDTATEAAATSSSWS